eukprot:TRINITY_DN2437_c0_g1_i2.p1 TRINITY_DN2437_c0_g1~~TRINITY_DN2437_c0_g1_i2.p1  ORF type:complete len:343 (+),score=19.36 TRINITY_DN2437_c0_g1_i2:61-1089(+)
MQMIAISVNSNNEVKSITESGSWMKTDISMILIFALGIYSIYYLVSFCHILYNNRNRVQREETVIANAALKILRKSPQSLPNKVEKPNAQQVYEDLKANLQNINVEPLEVLNRLQKLGVTPDIYIYNSLLDSCIKSKHFRSATQLFNEIGVSSSLVTPDVTTFNIYLKGIIEAINSGEHVDLGMIRELLKEMQAKDVHPNELTFSTVIDICETAGNTELALQYFMQIQGDFKLQPDSQIFSSLLKVIRANDKTPDYFDKIFEALLSFVRNKIECVDDTLINAIVDTAGKFSKIENIEQLRDILREKERRLTLTTYGKLITIYGVQKQVSKIDQVQSLSLIHI